MRQAEEEARKVEEDRKKAEEERKKFEAEKAENEAAVSIVSIVGHTSKKFCLLGTVICKLMLGLWRTLMVTTPKHVHTLCTTVNLLWSTVHVWPEIFDAIQFSQFSWLTGKPRKLNPWNKKREHTFPSSKIGSLEIFQLYGITLAPNTYLQGLPLR